MKLESKTLVGKWVGHPDADAAEKMTCVCVFTEDFPSGDAWQVRRWEDGHVVWLNDVVVTEPPPEPLRTEMWTALVAERLKGLRG